MSDMYFADAGPLVELTYDGDGKPLALLRGKVRDRDEDREALFAWLRALKAQILGAGPA